MCCFAVFTGMRSGVEIMALFGLYDITLIIKVAGVRSYMRYEIVKQVYFLILSVSRLFTVYEFAPVINLLAPEFYI
jgi:hypothetical protein